MFFVTYLPSYGMKRHVEQKTEEMYSVHYTSNEVGCAHWSYKINAQHSLQAQKPFTNVVYKDVVPLKKFSQISPLFMSFQG